MSGRLTARHRDDPLLDLAMAYAVLEDPNISTDALLSVRVTIGKYAQGILAFHEASLLVSAAIGPNHVLNKIEQILRTPLAPIPSPSAASGDPDSIIREKTRPWTSYEDQRLIAGLHRLGFSDWPAIAKYVGNDRTKSQCYQRWTRGLDPKIDRTEWTPEQDFRLLVLVAKHGEGSWAKISAGLPNRCDVQCRYRFLQLSRRPDFQATFNRAKELAPQLPEGQVIRPRPVPQPCFVPTYQPPPPVQVIQMIPGMPISFLPPQFQEMGMPCPFFGPPSSVPPNPFASAGPPGISRPPQMMMMPPPVLGPGGFGPWPANLTPGPLAR
jgi:hypothetical protein